MLWFCFTEVINRNRDAICNMSVQLLGSIRPCIQFYMLTFYRVDSSRYKQYNFPKRGKQRKTVILLYILFC